MPVRSSAAGLPAALTVRSLSKSFAGVQVLTGVSLDIAAGEVHALLGQNGSGKSTLIKCLAGVHRPDAGSGQVTVGGKELPHPLSPTESAASGLAFVHQDLGLIGDMTVAENLALGTGFERTGPLIRWGSQQRKARRILDDFGLAIPPTSRVRDLPVTARTLLAIARAFQPRGDAGSAPLACLILDEPTAALPDDDAELLFTAIRRVTEAGVGVGYVTHRLEEVFKIATRATILRDGYQVGTVSVADMTRSGLVAAIIGGQEARARADRTPELQQRPDDPHSVVLRAVELRGHRIRNATLELRAGEIVGVAGLAGTGRSELARLLFGSQVLTAGHRYLGGQAVLAGSPRQAMDVGIAMVPEDRRRDGCVLTMSTAQNLTMVTLPRNHLGLLDIRRERRTVSGSIDRFDIRPSDPDRHLSTLSGGNQQKVVLAKWLARRPKVLILDEPVQGVDVGAKADIFRQLRDAAAEGMAVLVIDSDFDNLVELCDRVLVLRAGEIVQELTGDHCTSARLSEATFGYPDEHPEVLLTADA